MAYFLSPIGNSQISDANGAPLFGGTINTFLAGTSTPATTYTSNTGATPQGPVITLDSLGTPTLGPVWLIGGVPLKFIIKDSGGNTLYSYDNIVGIGDVTLSADEFPYQTSTPTYISATSFSVLGDQTNTLQVLRRLKSINTGGTTYSTITASIFLAGVTTVTVLNTSGVLDAGLSAVSYGLLAAINPSVPAVYAKSGANSDITSLSGLTTALSVAQGGTGSATGPILRSYLTGLGMSTAGSSATMSIAAGVATDSTNVALLSVSAIAKTTANWVVGTAAGGKSLAAAIANNTWYHFYAIRRPDTGVTDVCFSTNASGLVAADFVAGGGNVPDAYTQFRRIGSGRTNGAAQWTLFFQDGDEFIWDTAVNDVAVTNPGTAAVTRTLTVPLGVVVETILSVYDAGVTTSHYTLLTSLAQADTVPSISNFSIANGSSLMRTINSRGVKTNTSAQIRTRQSASGVADEFYIVTLGWKDRRGRDA